MIARITGTIVEKSARTVVLEVAGIGYELVVPTTFLSSLAEGEVVQFHVAEHIKEDEYSLFGFGDAASRAMYYQLTSVNGVGPKAAMSILSTHMVADIQKAILHDEIAIFSSVSGIGRKTAQRIILELKGKLVAPVEEEAAVEDQAHQALLSLGYSAKDAHTALKDVSKDLGTQERIKQALKGAGK